MRLRGPWSVKQVATFLEASVIPVRLAVVQSNGVPLVLSLWFLPSGTNLRCATSRDAVVVDLLRGNPRCAFEVASDLPPYKGVRGQGTATLDEGDAPRVLDQLLERYRIPRTGKLGRMLLKRADKEIAIVIEPDRLVSWDFTSRMSD